MTSPHGTANETDNVYYAFVPAFDAVGGLIALSKPRLQAPSNPTNQLWITFLRYAIGLEGNRIKERHYQVCQLYNATYDLTLEWDGAFQNVTHSYEVLEEVHFPTGRPDPVSGMSRHSYSAFMWALTDQLVGAFSWFEELNQSNSGNLTQFGLIDTPIAHTSLLGSSDLDVFFDLNRDKGWSPTGNTTQLSSQRLQDKALAKNRTLDILIEELSFNTTVSLLHNELLTYNTTTKVVRWEPVNRYSYDPRDLFLPYAVANVSTLLIVLLGVVSYCRNGVLPNKKFGDIVIAVGDGRISYAV
ncbi:hypothetical protein EPUS_06275 [Endocarpon pusillum Z07020]|uniref:Uncharacterized protein n=1 Tax=Endocarpon pusillum (strain Z07020 / HMAS-L-300199) TaxID=1263415 RepID=U1GAU7_ENDPU|nr:uncharacterized protein EPUS_06275 [Endocarpon pusillum Z07020]ERF68831.1 hypothetical protein EPUS_06275 [Endocarpon pusillum Z07020]